MVPLVLTTAADRALQHVFSRDNIENWVEYKRSNEVDATRVRPHPHELELYFDA